MFLKIALFIFPFKMNNWLYKSSFFFFLILLKLTEKSVGRTIFTELFCNRRLLTSSYSNTICLLQVCQPPLPVDTHITMTKLHHQKQEQLKDIVQDKVLEFLFFIFYQRCKDCKIQLMGTQYPRNMRLGRAVSQWLPQIGIRRTREQPTLSKFAQSTLSNTNEGSHQRKDIVHTDIGNFKLKL